MLALAVGARDFKLQLTLSNTSELRETPYT